MWEVLSAGQLWHRLRDCEKMYDDVMQLAGDPPRRATRLELPPLVGCIAWLADLATYHKPDPILKYLCNL
jgi:hypothetical protein